MLTRTELLTVYVLLAPGSNPSGHDQPQIHFTTLASVNFRATPENRWDELIVPYLPGKVMLPVRALKPLFEGPRPSTVRDTGRGGDPLWV